MSTPQPWSQPPVSRLGYDGEECIYFDRTKPCSDPDEVDSEGQPLSEECDPLELYAELEAENAALKQKVSDVEVAMDKIYTPGQPGSVLQACIALALLGPSIHNIWTLLRKALAAREADTDD